MKKRLCIVLLLVVLLCNQALALSTQQQTGETNLYLAFIPDHSVYFADVNTSYAWAYSEIDFLANGNVVTGGGQHLFYPQNSITRADFLLMLYRAYDMSSYATQADSFSDVKLGAYYAKALSAAKALGIASGSNGKFYPADKMKRQDAMVFLKRTLDLTGISFQSGSLAGFSDASQVDAYAKDAVGALVGAGVVNGSDGKLNPKASVTRAEMAVLLYRALHLSAKQPVYSENKTLVNLCLGAQFYTDVVIENFESGKSYRNLMECIQFRHTQDGYAVRLGDTYAINQTATYKNGVLRVDNQELRIAQDCTAINVSGYSRLDGICSTGDKLKYCRPSFLDGEVVAVYYTQ